MGEGVFLVLVGVGEGFGEFREGKNGVWSEVKGVVDRNGGYLGLEGRRMNLGRECFMLDVVGNRERESIFFGDIVVDLEGVSRC